MQKINRAGGCWINTVDPVTNEVVNIHIDNMRQETIDPFSPSAVVVSFSQFRTQEVVELNDLSKAKAVPFVFQDERELVLMLDMASGANSVKLFQRVAQVVALIAIEKHKPMTYKAYRTYLEQQQSKGLDYLCHEDEEEPAEQPAVWGVVFVREYGLVNGLFAITREYAAHFAGYKLKEEVYPGSLYQFPENYVLETDVSATDFVGVLRVLLDQVMANGSLIKADKYRMAKAS